MTVAQYMGKNHQVLVTGSTYEIVSASDTDVQLRTPTGFAGVPISDIKLIHKDSQWKSL